MRILSTISKIVVLAFFITGCKQSTDTIENLNEDKEDSLKINEETAWYVEPKIIQGLTQGTTFTIKTSDDTLYLSPEEINTLFSEFDRELSGYIPNSLVSQFNASDSLMITETKFFQDCYMQSMEVYEKTKGAFDPSVFPLVKAWGFFQDIENPPSENIIDSILEFTGFKEGLHHVMKDGKLIKKDKRFQLDFNAIAQGQSVDAVANYLDEKGQMNYFIEIGGEIRVKGVNNENNLWVIGIDEPVPNNTGQGARKLENYLGLTNISVATSGSYRKFYEKNGKKYSHTIDPKTGRPVEHNLLSTTVISKKASTADAYATAFMAMGVEKTLEFIQSNPQLNLEVYLLFQNKEGRIERAYSRGVPNFLLN
ncbi:MAG: FAD:protein FMN transferase [Brumimicrobium sp.]|nr:FAD:protein FMN transferase [Brumimicrobium sp.]